MTRWGARFLGRRFACSIGRGGIGEKTREGDAVTPRAVWRITAALYRPDRLHPFPTHVRLTACGLYDIWSDDPADPAYNHGLRAMAHPFSHERLRRSDPLYDLVLTSDWNWPDAKPGKGSAIFLHRWRKPRHPTAGCIAFSPADLKWIATRLSPRSRVILRQE